MSKKNNDFHPPKLPLQDVHPKVNKVDIQKPVEVKSEAIGISAKVAEEKLAEEREASLALNEDFLPSNELDQANSSRKPQEVEKAVVKLLEQKLEDNTINEPEKTLLDHLKLGQEFLTLDDVELYTTLEATASGNTLSDGHTAPAAVQFGILGEVGSIPRDLDYALEFEEATEYPPPFLEEDTPLVPPTEPTPPVVSLQPIRFIADITINEGRQEYFAGETEPSGTLGQQVVLATNLFSGGTSSLGTVIFSLGVTNGTLSGHIDSNTGSAIELINNNGMIQGHVVGQPADVLAFTISVDTSGNLTLTQYRSVVHPVHTSSGLTSDEETSTGFIPNVLHLVATMVDGSGSVIRTEGDLGVHLKFIDDTPRNNDVSLAPQTTYEDALTSGNGGVGETTTSVTYTMASIATLIDPGSDTPTTFILNTNISGNTGLTQNGHPITWSYDASTNTIKGIDSIDLSPVFTISREANGDVTFTLTGHIDNGTGDGNNTSLDFSQALIAIDSDGDSMTLDSGLIVYINNDIPIANLAVGTEAGIVLTTKDANTIGANTDIDVSTANFSGIFTNSSSYGADGPGSGVMTYALSLAVPAGNTSGFTSHGDTVYLYNVAGVITASTSASLAGVTSANTVFSISVDSSTGIVTLSQMQQIDHSVETTTTAPFEDQFATLANGLVNLSATLVITDYDGDTATDTKSIDLGGNVRFADHGPTVTINVENESAIFLTTQDADTIGVNTDTDISSANFSDLFNAIPNYGADGAGSTVMTYALALTVSNGSSSGFTSHGNTVYLYDIGGLITASTSATLAGIDASNTIFSIGVDNATGVVTLFQMQQIDHAAESPSNAPFDDQFAILANNLVTLTGTALTTDYDGDTATNSATIDLGGNIRFADHGPTVTLDVGTEANIVLTTQDANSIGAATDVATTAANFGGLFTSTANFGADGAGSSTMSYSLTLVTAGANSGLQSHGAAIYLYSIGGVITGSTSNSLAGVTTGNTIFSIGVNSTTGVVTLSQMQQIDHSSEAITTDPFNDQFATLGNELVNLSATIVVTDFDGDTASDTKSIDLGGNIRFGDDGPTVTVNTGNEATVLLTTQDADTIGVATDTATANFGTLFATTPNYGADGAGTTVMSYALGLVTAGADSGLDSNGANIYLHNIAGVITGSTSANVAGVTSGNTIFSVSVNSTTGVVTLSQMQQIDHASESPSNAPFDDQFAILANNLVTLTGTALTTDYDGDTATSSATIDLGGNIRFADHGPTVTVSTGNEATVLLTTQDADTIGTATDIATANFGALFTNSPNYGADGAATTVMSYALGLVTAGADSGLDSNGANIYLHNIAGVITGSTSANVAGVTCGNTIFSVSVNSTTGVVTLSQMQQIDHAAENPSNAPFDDQFAILANNLVTLTGTALTTDYDGDTATNSATIDLGGNIRFADHGPTVNVTTGNEAATLLTTQDSRTIGTATDTATANFGTLFTSNPNYGADGAGTTIMSYALGLVTAGADSGLNSNSSNVYLYNINGVITGSTSTDVAGVTGGNTIFSIAVDSATGIVTLSQMQQIDHALESTTTAPFNDQFAILANNLVTLTGTALTTDYDGDTATNSATIDLGGNIRFADHGPTVNLNTSSDAAVLLITQDANTIGAATDTATANFGTLFTSNPNYGADGAGTTVISYALSVVVAGVDSGLNSNGANVYLHNINGVITGSTSTDVAGVTTGNTIFSIAVDSATGIVTLSQMQQIDHATESPTTAPFNDQFVILANNLVTLTGTALTTDHDGDTATSSATINLGGNIRFADHGPTVTLNVGTEDNIVLTTQDANTIGAATDTVSSTASFGNIFTSIANYGADAAGSTVITYTLTLVTAGANSGLQSQGSSIYLYSIGGVNGIGAVITGSTSTTLAGVTSGNTIFSIGVNSTTGVVTLSQMQQIDHSAEAITTAPFNDQFSILADGLVNLNATVVVTDFDRDTASDTKSIDLGGNIRFADHGPTVTVTTGNEAAVLLTTQDADTIGAATDIAIANFGTLFATTPNYGADGAGSTVMSYALGLVTAGADSGLDSNGANIYLHNIAGVITGSTSANVAAVNSGNTIFSVSVNPTTGVVTLSQMQQIDHALESTTTAPFDDQFAILANNLVTLTGTALTTDYDGDTATSSATIDLGGNIRFADHGPTVTVSTGNEATVLLTTQDADTIGAATDTATANFGTLFATTPSYGADGAGTTVMSYALGLVTAGADSGLDSNGANIYLHNIAGVITGSTSASVAGVTTGNTIFSISINGTTGVVTLSQMQQIDHAGESPSNAPFDDQFAILANNLVTLTGTALTTDYDGDTATNSATIDLGGNIRFADHGPTVTVSTGNEAAVLLTTQDADTIGAATDIATANFGALFTNSPNYGADGAGTTVISYALGLVTAGADSGLDSNGANIYLHNINGVITGSTSANVAAVNSGNTIFSVSVNSTTGVVTLSQMQQIDHALESTTTAPFDDQFAILANNLVTLTGTALTTDYDGDTATNSATIDLGGNIRFADHGPTVTLDVGTEANIVLTTQDANSIGAATDVATTAANFGGLFTSTANFGADGAGSNTMSYSLTLVTAGANSGLQSHAAAIYLYSIGGVITGSTSNSLAGVTTGNTIFSIGVNSTTGVVTLSQMQQIDHSLEAITTAPFNDQFSTLADGLVNLNATIVVTDFDGDTASDTKSIDLGGNIRFGDDGPTVTVNTGNEATVLLTTQDADTIGVATDTATANFGTLFATTPNYGADGAGTTVMSYALGLVTAGADSGLDSNGANIYLHNINGVITGSTSANAAVVTSGNTIFSVSVNGTTGVVTLSQMQQIDHAGESPSNAPFNDQFAILANNLVTLTGTALTTDYDGDTATNSATIDLGGNIRFADHGPTVTVSTGNEATVLLTTQDADTIGAATDTATANFGTLFATTPNYGADGAGSTVMSYALGLVAAGTDSGLDSNGANIYLHNIAGVITGSTSANVAAVNSGNTIFSVSVNPTTGVVTLSQMQQIDHALESTTTAPFDDQFAILANNLVTLTGTALTTDYDGDTATNSATIDLGGNIRFADHGPTVTVNTGNEAAVLLTTQDGDTIGVATDTATANFGTLFATTPNYGADGAGSTVMSYTLALAVAAGTDSGLDSNGANIYLHNINGVITGSTSANAATVTSGNTIFSIAVDSATGVVTLSQMQQIDHAAESPSNAPFDDQFATLANNLVTLTGTALTTDYDGDTATNSATIDLGGNIRFADHGPTVTVNTGNEATVLLTTQDADTIGVATDTATANFGTLFATTPNYGADGAGTTVMSYSLGLVAAGADSGLDSNGANIYLHNIAGVITGSTSTNVAGVTSGNTIFSVSVNSTTGVVTLSQMQQIDHALESTTTAPFDDQFAILANNLVTLTGTALTTDYDGDTATNSATIDLGGNIRFADHGPTVTLDVGTEANIVLTTQDANSIGAATDVATTAANFGGLFTNTANFGADGAGSSTMSYSLTLLTAGANSGLQSHGAAIYLYSIGGVITGSTSANVAGVTAGNTIFSIGVNGTTGVVTLSQMQQIDHSLEAITTAPFNDQFSTLANGLVNLNATIVVTDFDGDTASDTKSIDLGGNIRFGDDGPTVTVNTGNEATVLLTTQDADTIGVATDTATANFGTLFATTPNYGADGAGTTVMSYALGLVTAAADSGLDSNGANIYLHNINGVITGSTSANAAAVTSGNTIFSIAVDSATGVVTLSQMQQIDHAGESPSNAPFDDQFAILANNLVTLTGTALTTDYDGDTATNSATIDLGGNIRFADHGPSVTVSTDNEAAVLLTTQDADTIGAATDTATANFGTLFATTPNYGADGAGTTVMSYSLGLVAAGADSGLDSNGANIYLHNINGVITGSTSANVAGVTTGNTIFSISINGTTGVVTLSQMQQIDHALESTTTAPFDDQFAILANNLVTLTGTALTTDYDGDTATSSATIDLGGNIRFADHGPTVTVSTGNEATVLLTTQDADTIGVATDTATANFGALFTNSPNYGADGAGTTVMSYALGLVAAGTDSGLDSNGANIYLHNIAGVITGSTSANVAGVTSGNTIFSVSVNSTTGVVTLSQMQQIDHALESTTTAPFDDQFAILANNLVTLTGTALTTDYDGDTATSSATIDLGGNIRFADHGPTVTVSTGNEATVLLTTQDADTIGAATDIATANFGALFTNSPNYGADGAGTTVMSYALGLVAAGADSGLDSNGANIYLHNINGVITGSTSANAAAVNSGNTIFSVSVNPTTGVVTLSQMQQIDHALESTTTAPFDDQFAILANNLVTLTGTALTTDYDGDTATSSVTIDLGGNIRFADHGPTVTVSTGNEATVLLTTQDADTIGVATDTATANFGALFTNSPNYGADGAGTTVMSYALGLVAAGTDSGLDSNGANIYLHNIAGVITGSTSANVAGVTSGNTIFSVSVNSTTGVVTLSQMQQIDHAGESPSNAPFDDQFAILANNLVTLTGTALTTDYDGDTATNSATIDLGGNIRFADHGPTVTLNIGNEANIVLTTQDANTIGAATDVISSTANFGNIFTSVTNYGADGGGSTAMTYSVTLVTAGANSGLQSQGSNIYLYSIGGVITGSTSTTLAGVTTGNTIFSIGVNSSTGVVTLSQMQQIDHSLEAITTAPFNDQFSTLANGLVRLNATVLVNDFDGDTATDTKFIDLGGNIRFADDGPSISVVANTGVSVIHDETPGIQSGSNDISGTSFIVGSSGATVASLFSGLVNTGNDSDVVDNPIGYARSGGSMVNATVTPGADGEASRAYSLSVTNGNNSGVSTTEGTQIFLYQISSTLVVGRVGTETGVNDTANSNGTIAFAISTNPATGEVFTVQYLSLKHPTFPNNPNESVSLTGTEVKMNVTVTDRDGDTATGTANIGSQILFNDDGPTAKNITVSGQAQGSNTNVMLILDTSGSMDDNYNEGINALKLSALQLLDKYDAFGDVMVRIVVFDTRSSTSGSTWMTVADARAVIFGLTTGGNTNFDDALAQVTGVPSTNYSTGAFNSSGAISGAQNVSYFISDGNPNENAISSPGVRNQPFGNSDGIDNSETSAWEAFLRDTNGNAAGGSQIRSYALGLGNDVSISNLNPIAYDGYTETNTNAILINNLADLSTTLTNTILAAPINGNLMTDPNPDASFGSDGGRVLSITVNGITYTYNATTNAIVTSGTATSGSNSFTFNTSTHVLTVTMDSSGNPTGDKIAMDMDDGSYTYTPPDIIASGSINRLINFTLIDNDGDTSSAVLTVDINVNNPTVLSAQGDLILTNQASGSNTIVIPTWALLANDIGSTGGSFISAVSNALSGSVSNSGSDITFIDNTGSNGGIFTYSNTTGSETDSANVLIDRSQAGSSTLNGSDNAEILIGRSNNDTINGGGGNDILIGLAGNDTLNGGAGDDILSGGLGNNTLNGGTGNNTVTYMDATGGITISLAITTQQNTGGAGRDTLSNIQNIIGSNFNDVLTGNAQSNIIIGGGGVDTIRGAAGADILTGGAGADTFVYNAIGDSGTTLATADIITDFTPGVDKIDLSSIDANTSMWFDQDFGFTNTTATAHSVWLTFSATQTFVNIDNNGNTTADMTITLNGVMPTISSSDFIL